MHHNLKSFQDGYLSHQKYPLTQANLGPLYLPCLPERLENLFRIIISLLFPGIKQTTQCTQISSCKYQLILFIKGNHCSLPTSSLIEKFQPIFMFDNNGRVNEKIWLSFDGCTGNIKVLTMLILISFIVSLYI